MSAAVRLSVWFLVVVLVFVTAGLVEGIEPARPGVTGRISDEAKKVEELIKALEQRNWQNSIDSLVQIGEPAVEPLIRTLKDTSIKTWVIHARAVNALAKIGTRQAVEAVTESLKNKESNDYVRGFAAIALGDIKSSEAIEPLIEALTDESQFVRWKCAQALGKLCHKQGSNALILALKDEDQYVRAAAARSLGKIKSQKAGYALVNAFQDGHWFVRLNSRNALLEIDKPAVEYLIKALNDKNPQVRWQAAWALGRIKTEKAVELLIEALGDSDWMVRDEAAVALVRINSKEAIEPLKEALKRKTGYIRDEAAWVLGQMKSDKAVEKNKNQDKSSRKIPINQVSCGQKTYPCYPETLDARPVVPSPHTTLDGAVIVTAFTKDRKYTLIPVTVENGEPLNYKQGQWGKGRQLEVDAADFPTLAGTGLHSEAELNQTKMITGRSIVEITELGRPGRSSGAGFMSDDEDIISVLKGDNRLVSKLGLSHPQMAGPLFHVWNMILTDVESNRLGRFWEHFEYLLYNGKKVHLKAEGTKGWQESLFEDEVLGTFQFEVWRELEPGDKAFLREKYSHLSEEQMTEFVKKLSYIHTGEMVPYYIMRYGFYEGHTDYRADPIAIAYIFGLRSLAEIENTFPGNLYDVLTEHFVRK